MEILYIYTKYFTLITKLQTLITNLSPHHLFALFAFFALSHFPSTKKNDCRHYHVDSHTTMNNQFFLF